MPDEVARTCTNDALREEAARSSSPPERTEELVKQVARSISDAAYGEMRAQGFSGGWDHDQLGRAIALAALQSLGHAEMERENARLREALTKCADKFDHYEQLHRLKCTSEGDEKGDRNREMADMCRTALRGDREQGEG